MNFRYPHPDNEKSFEKFCLKLLHRHWSNPQLELYGRRGEGQLGVNIIDPTYATPFKAAQCKHHEPLITIPPSEIEKEVTKALAFDPPLDHYAILTSGRATTQAQNKVIEINREHRAKGLFIVELLWWEKIEDLLDDYPDVADLLTKITNTHLAELKENVAQGFLAVSTQLDAAMTATASVGFDAELDEADAYLTNHDPQLAQVHFEKIRKRHWDSLSPSQKYRVKLGLSNVALSQGNDVEAGRTLIEAKALCPDSERAQVNEAIGYEFIGATEQAHALAAELLNTYPHSAKAVACWVRTAPEEATFEELKNRVPVSLERDSDVCTSLAFRANQERRFVEAEASARLAIAAKPTWPGPKMLLAQAILQQELGKRAQSSWTNRQPTDVRRLDDAISSYTETIELATQQKTTHFLVDCFAGRALARAVGGDHKLAEYDFQRVVQLVPDNASAYFRYGTFLAEVMRMEEAIAQLRRSVAIKKGAEAQHCLATLLADRGQPGDPAEAADIAASLARTDDASLASSTPAPDPDQLKGIRALSFSMAVHLYVNALNLEAASKLVSDIRADRVSQVSLATARSQIREAEGDVVAAAKLAEEALGLVEEATPKADLRELALQLMKLERHKEALPLWEKLNESPEHSNDARYLVRCAERVGQLRVVLRVCRSARETGVGDKWFLDRELQVLEQFDTAEAVSVLEGYLAEHPDDKFARIRLSRIGFLLKRPDLIDAGPEALPSVDEATPYGGHVAVEIMRHYGDPNAAVRYAYDLARKYHEDHIANASLVMAVLGLGGQEPTFEETTEVRPGTAVRYIEPSGKEKWAVIEDSPNPNGALSEFPESHPTAEALMGKRVGDTVVLAKTSARDRTAVVQEILPKFVYRMRDIAENWQLRFPDKPFVQVFRVAAVDTSTGEPQPDFTDLKLVADRRYQRTGEAEAIYQRDLVSIHGFASLLGCDAYDAFVFAALRPQLHIRSNRGLPDEKKSASEALESSHTLVLDITAIASAALLEFDDLLANWKGKLVISQSTAGELRSILDDAGASRRRDAHFGKVDQGYYLQDVNPEYANARAEQFTRFADFILRTCETRSCPEVVDLEPERREQLLTVFGQHGLESMLLARAPGHVLWTEDIVVSDVGLTEFGTRRAWTQVVLEHAANTGIVPQELYLSISAKLVGLGYQTTTFNPSVIIKSGSMCEWDADRWPFSKVLEQFANETIPVPDILGLAAVTTVAMHKGALLVERRQATLIRILERIGSRKSGLSAVRLLLGVLPMLFGLNVLASDEATEVVNSWLAEASRRVSLP